MSRGLLKANIAHPKVLMIGANSQRGRQTGFENRLKELIPNAKVTGHDDGHFARDEAKRIARHYLEDTRRQPWPFEGVYCTNDEMALGVAEVLLTLPKEQRNKVVVIGYDGIQEARVAIDRGDMLLRNTVVQNTEVLAEQAVQLLLRLLRKKKPIKRINKLRPRLYRDVRTSPGA